MSQVHFQSYHMNIMLMLNVPSYEIKCELWLCAPRLNNTMTNVLLTNISSESRMQTNHYIYFKHNGAKNQVKPDSIQEAHAGTSTIIRTIIVSLAISHGINPDPTRIQSRAYLLTYCVISNLTSSAEPEPDLLSWHLFC